jgi:SIR2-like domain
VSAHPSTEQTVSEEMARHFHSACRGFERGQLTLVLGAGASLFGRAAAGKEWAGAPDSQELAARLAAAFGIKPKDRSRGLVEVAQSVYVINGWEDLYEELHETFLPGFAPTRLHTFLAGMATSFRDSERHLRGCPLILTTNFDDLIEQAYAEREPFDLLTYIADGPSKGRFLHHSPAGFSKVITEPEKCTGVDPAKRTVIVKLHGCVNRDSADCDDDSYVIAEDHYIQYLTHRVDEMLPPGVISRLKRSHLLFLGYSLRDWNVRAIIEAMRIDRTRKAWWAVMANPGDDLEEESWRHRRVEIIKLELETYLEGLEGYLAQYLQAVP